MPEPFKNLINPDLVRACGEHLQSHWRAFDRRSFERHALEGLDALEMKARAMQVADALEATLPDDFDRAAGIIEAALAPPATTDELAFRVTDAGLAGWIGWPLGEYIARRGQADPERGLLALHALTQRFTSEFAVRPFLLNHFRPTLAQLQRWSSDPSPHVRRWTSEGSRPRLPWGLQLKSLIADPTPTLPLLRTLQDDPSPYVRRSVANHLNDIAKDHPGLVADWLEQHLPDAPPERTALLALRVPHSLQTADVIHVRGLVADALPEADDAPEPLGVTPVPRARPSWGQFLLMFLGFVAVSRILMFVIHVLLQ